MTVQLMAGVYKTRGNKHAKVLIGRISELPEKQGKLTERTLPINLDEVTEEQLGNQLTVLLAEEFLVGGCQGWRVVHSHGGLTIYEFDFDSAL